MELLLQSLWEAIQLIYRFDRELLSALVTTLRVSLTSTAIAGLISLPLGFFIARFNFTGKRGVLVLLRTALALPTVVVGLFVYAFIARNAPLGEMGLLFTPVAIIIGQVLLIVPLITALVHSSIQENVLVIYEEALILGASPLRASVKTIVESRFAVVTALMTGFGRVVSEVGISLVLGGNIRGFTRTITTAITLETSQGDFAAAFALGMVLLTLVFIVTLFIQALDRRNESV
ncbi:MAG: ABC transporter permease subunit [bacterium]|nr:ABC transporter permease subunit [bacterium]